MQRAPTRSSSSLEKTFPTGLWLLALAVFYPGTMLLNC